MLTKVAPLLVLAGLTTQLNRYGLPDVDGVGTLDADTFHEFVSSRPFTLVLFTKKEDVSYSAHWREFAKLAEKASSENLKLPVTSVDVETDSALAEELQVTETPAIVLVSESKRLVYEGRVTAEAIYDWAIRYSRDKDDRELRTRAEVDQVSKMRFAVLVRFPKGDSKQASSFAAAADADSDAPYYYTHLELSGIVFGAEAAYNIIVFRTFDDGTKLMSHDSPFSTESIRQFAHMFRQPMIHPFDSDLTEKVYAGNITALVYFAKNHTRTHNETFNSFAFRNRHKIRIYQCEFSDFACLNLAYSVGHDDKEPFSVFILENKGKGLSRYKMKGAFEEKTLTAFVDNYNQGLLTPYAKSEPEPMDNSGILKKVVRNTVSRLVLDSERTTVLFAYSETPEWEALEPLAEELAMKYGLSGKIGFFKWDASKNEHEMIYLTRVPQVLVFKSGNKGRPAIYLGKMKPEKIRKFVEDVLGEEVSAKESKDTISTEL